MNTSEEYELDLMLPILHLVGLQAGDDDMPSLKHERFDVDGLMRLAAIESGSSPYEKTRKRDAVTSRVIVAYRLFLSGYGLSSIGRIIHKKHCTISYYVEKMEFILDHPSMYPDVIYVWNKVIQQYPL